MFIKEQYFFILLANIFRFKYLKLFFIFLSNLNKSFISIDIDIMSIKWTFLLLYYLINYHSNVIQGSLFFVND